MPPRVPARRRSVAAPGHPRADCCHVNACRVVVSTSAMSSPRSAGRPGMETIDFGPATTAVGRLVRGVRDDQLGAPTPCPDYTVGDLLDHLGGLAVAFRDAATKETPPGGAQPQADGSSLEDGWRDRIATALD